MCIGHYYHFMCTFPYACMSNTLTQTCTHKHMYNSHVLSPRYMHIIYAHMYICVHTDTDNAYMKEHMISNTCTCVYMPICRHMPSLKSLVGGPLAWSGGSPTGVTNCESSFVPHYMHYMSLETFQSSSGPSKWLHPLTFPGSAQRSCAVSLQAEPHENWGPVLRGSRVWQVRLSELHPSTTWCLRNWAFSARSTARAVEDEINGIRGKGDRPEHCSGKVHCPEEPH